MAPEASTTDVWSRRTAHPALPVGCWVETVALRVRLAQVIPAPSRRCGATGGSDRKHARARRNARRRPGQLFYLYIHVSVYMCVCVYQYNIYIYVYIYMYVYGYMYMYMYMCVCVCVCARAFSTHAPAYADTRVNTE
jgi:hypothetical protein